jgi:hypothetical protein
MSQAIALLLEANLDNCVGPNPDAPFHRAQGRVRRASFSKYVIAALAETGVRLKMHDLSHFASTMV